MKTSSVTGSARKSTAEIWQEIKGLERARLERNGG